MSITSGRQIITKVGEYLHLAHVTVSGTQISIENFIDLQEAFTFCEGHKIKGHIEIDSGYVAFRDCVVCVNLAAAKMTTIKNLAKTIGSSVAAVKASCQRLAARGEVAIKGDLKSAPGLAMISLTTSGNVLAASLRPTE